MPQVILRLEGYPDSTIVHVATADLAFTGDVTFTLRANNDPSQEWPIPQLVASVSNGKGDAVVGNLRDTRLRGWNELFAVYNGDKLTSIPLPSVAMPVLNPPQAQQPATGTKAADPSLDGLQLRFAKTKDLVLVKGAVISYQLSTLTTVSRNNSTVEDVTVDFFVDDAKQPESNGDGLQSNEDGEIPYTFKNLKPGKNDRVVTLRAKIRKTNISKTLQVTIPKARRQDDDDNGSGDKAQYGITLTASAGSGTLKGDKMVHVVTLQATTRKGTTVSVDQINWNCGGLSGNVNGSTGYVTHKVEVSEPGEHMYTAYSPTAKVSSRPIKLSGPPEDKSGATGKPARLTEPNYTGYVDAATPDTKTWQIFFTVLDIKGNGVSKAKVVRMCGSDMPKEIPADDFGNVQDTVQVKGFNAKVTCKVFVPGLEAKTMELTGPDKNEDKHSYEIDADLDTPHPVGGKFVIAGTTTMDGKPGTCVCTISSAPDDAVVTGRLGKVEPGADPGTYKLTTAASGKFKLVVDAKDNTLTFTAPDGTSCDVPMILPR